MLTASYIIMLISATIMIVQDPDHLHDWVVKAVGYSFLVSSIATGFLIIS